ncbi:MAG: nitroreductase [Desulfosudaceae bacterium]
MELKKAAKARRSIRRFKPDPVDVKTLRGILSLARYAPSAMNTQPWTFVVVSGEPLEAIKKENIERLRSGKTAQPEHSTSVWPKNSVFRQRQVDLGKQLFTLMKIPRDNPDKRLDWMERGYRFFDAPAAIIITYDKVFTKPGPLLDLGAVMQMICLAATDAGLGTCIEDQGVHYPEVLRQHARIPESKVISTAIAIGHPDPDFPANQVNSGRAAVDELTIWVGFD